MVVVSQLGQLLYNTLLVDRTQVQANNQYIGWVIGLD